MASSVCFTRVLTIDECRKRVRARFRCGADVGEPRWPANPCAGGFTLVELLVVIAVAAILAAVLFPVLASARSAGKKVRCVSQLKQLALAVLMYADDNNTRFVPAASDIDGPGGGLKRWHGTRKDTDSAFDPKAGPLWAYLARSEGLKECPSAPWRTTKPADRDGFEAGCGGFGYNRDYVGGTYHRNPFPLSARLASTASDIRRPSKTVMFADTAMPCATENRPEEHLIEYSFCEPPYAVFGGSTRWRTCPSIHFRHNGTASVAWCDGHVTSERMTMTEPTNIYGASNAAFEVGWFGPDDNSLFDLE